MDFHLRSDDRLYQGYLEPFHEIRSTTIDLPPGLIGNPTAYDTCEDAELNRTDPVQGVSGVCDPASQVGVVHLHIQAYDPGEGSGSHLVESESILALYNMKRGPDQPGRLAFSFQGFVSGIIQLGVRSDGDYGVRATVSRLESSTEILGADVTLWGNPADSSHDGLRGECLPPLSAAPTGNECPFPAGRKHGPFMTNPTRCGVPVAGQFSADFYDTAEVLGLSSAPQEFGGCAALPFAPTLAATPGSARASEPAGFEVDLRLPQATAADAPATSALRDAVVTLPPGVAISPPSADGLAACTDAQFGLHELGAESCPEASKIGTAEVVTPLLEAPLPGSLYLGSQLSDDPQSGRMYRLFLVVAGAGVRIKLEGSVKADPVTGQLTATFDENPQLPFEELRVVLNSGPRSPLQTPTACGTYTTTAALTPWSGTAPVESTSSFTIGENCGVGSQFTPSLSAGVADPQAGGSSTFSLELNRPDGQQNVSTLAVTLPEGQLAKLAGVPLCGEAEASTGNCPGGSQVGTTTIAAGSGSDPLYVPQPGRPPSAVYLAGPYRGAPYSLVVKVPAQAGPFDLGTVTVRTALRVDPTTTQVTAVTDPLPQILKGIPVSYRRIDVTIDRPGFIQNPTDCAPTAITSTITSAAGAVAHPSSPYGTVGCAGLGFGPKLALSLSGGTTRAKNPALRAVLTAGAGQANLGRVQVILPRGLFIDNRHISNPCTRVQFDAGAGNGAECPAKSILGTATAYTPLLDQPLTGPVYFRSNGGERKLPDLVASLGGQIHVNLVGFIDSVHRRGTQISRTRTTFADVPDAAISRFVFNLRGGKRGLLQNSINLCDSVNRAIVRMEAQSGKVRDLNPVVRPHCGTGAKRR